MSPIHFRENEPAVAIPKLDEDIHTYISENAFYDFHNEWLSIRFDQFEGASKVPDALGVATRECSAERVSCRRFLKT